MGAVLKGVAVAVVAGMVGGCAMHGGRRTLQEYADGLALGMEGPSVLRVGTHQDVAWREAVVVPHVATGPALLTVHVEVVSLRHCDRRRGCYSTMLKASARGVVE